MNWLKVTDVHLVRSFNFSSGSWLRGANTTPG
jgi:hypothetical protein